MNGLSLKQFDQFRYLDSTINEKWSLSRLAAHTTTNVLWSFYGFQQKIENLPNSHNYRTVEKMVEANSVSVANFSGEICEANKDANKFPIRCFKKYFKLKAGTPTDAYYFLTGKFPLHFRQIEFQLKFLSRTANN